MEKTVQITIASMQFQVTESAYTLLRSYLDRLSAHFGDNTESAEIVRDIESRIAEKFIDAKHKLVTEKDVHAVISEIGDAAAFGDESTGEPAPASEAKSGERKLYRNGDDAIIAGVASGLAAYFGWNTMIVRLVFAISVLFSGVGVAIYIVLWLIMPEAKSASQKLEMKGTPVTLETITQVVKDRVDETRERGSFNRIVRFPAEVIRMMSLTMLPLTKKIVGFLLSIGAFFAFIGVSAVLALVLFNWNASWNDIPHKEFISTGLLRTLLVIGYVALIIPIFFVFSLGQRWFKSRTLVSTVAGFGLMGVWALSIVTTGALATRIIGDYVAYTASSPEYAQTLETHEVGTFHTLNIENANVTFKIADTYSVQVSGRKIDLNNASTSLTDGVLTIAGIREHDGPCLFCHSATPSVTVTAPQLDTITVRSGSLGLDDLNVPSMNITARNSNVSGRATITSLYLTLDSSWTNMNLKSRDIRVDANNARAELDGTTDTFYVQAKSSSVNSEDLTAQETKVDAQNSSVHVRSDKTFEILNDRDSDVQNAGTVAGVSESVESDQTN